MVANQHKSGGIAWTDETWNPLRGCTRVSEGCRNCYAERIAARFSGAGEPYEGIAEISPHGPRWTGVIRLVPGKLGEPLRWRKPRMIFVNSMSDLFHKYVPTEFIDQVFGIIARSPWHTYQILTKRPARMAEYLNDPDTRRRIFDATGNEDDGYPIPLGSWVWPLRQVWLGTSIENSDYKWRLDELRKVPAAVRFVSFEPLLADMGTVDLTGIQWAITGAESGPGARPMDEDWVRSLRDQCEAAGVAFFYKQRVENGKKVPLPELDGKVWDRMPQEVF